MPLSSVFHVQGPFKIEVHDGANGSSWVELGIADNDDSVSLTFRPLVRTLTSVTSGDEPEEVIALGTTASLSFSLVKWVQTSKALLLTGAGDTAEGDGSVVGARYSTDGSSGTEWFAFRITAVDAAGNDVVSAARPRYTVHRCFIGDGDEVGLESFGNNHTRLVGRVTAIRNASAKIYTRDTSAS